MSERTPGEALDLEVRSRTEVADDVVALELADPAGGELPAWEPGAHVDLVLSPGLVRQYSLCGSREDRGTWTVAVLREEDGRGGSREVHDRIAVGDKVAIRGPRNHFPLVDAESYVFVAGGIGITPILPMVAEVDRRGLPWRLVYGGRSRSRMAFASELADRYGERVTLHPQDRSGLLDLDGILASAPAGAAIYCCGPGALLDAIEERHAGRPGAGPLHVERFAPRTRQEPAGGVGGDGDFEVELASSGRVVPVPAGVSVVEALEEAGVPVETSCREGTCGTCETAVLGGTPDHRDSILDDDERAAGDVVFPCVSRATSARLILDL